MSMPSFSLASRWQRVFDCGNRKSYRAGNDLEALLARMGHRLYPETIPVLVSCWLKTVYARGPKRGWWKDLSEQLKQVLCEQLLDVPSCEALSDLQTWIQQSVLLASKIPEAQPVRLQPFRADLTPERVAPYIGRLLNEWLPAEVASLFIHENWSATPQDSGVPVLAVGRALERLLVREHLSPATLEMLLQPELLSPQHVYPADAEILRDVVLALLGRTWAPPAPVMPATILGVAAGSPFPADYREAVRHASFVKCGGREEVHVPIGAAEALEILERAPVRIGSIIVTMDGRWWESENLQSGEQHMVVYKPGGRLRIDYSVDHAKLAVPWPDLQLRWPGPVHFRNPFEIFGREWHASRWEMDGQRTWLHLAFSRALPMVDIQQTADVSIRRSHPASVDMAWAALENALATSLLQRSSEPIEQLRRSDLIPLGRALYGFADTVKNGWWAKRETMETQLRRIRYFQAEVSLLYGRVPWRILPASVQGTFLKRSPDPALLELLNQVFDELPEVFSEAIRRGPSSGQAAPPTSPPQAA